MIETRKLGRTNLEVTVLGFGSAPLGELYKHVDEITAIKTVETAADYGINLFDTAPYYGQGIAEHRVGNGLRRAKLERFYLSSKIGRVLIPAPHGRINTSRFVGGLEFNVIHDYSYDGVMRSLEDSLMRLGLASLDILLIHDADTWVHSSEVGAKYYREAMDGAHRALEKLRSEKVIKAMGFGTNDTVYAAKFLREGDFDCFLLAGRYTLLEQSALTEVLPLAKKKNIGVMLGGVFNSGILATGPIVGAFYNYTLAPKRVMDKVGKIKVVCDRYGVPLHVAALQFCMGHPQVSSLVLGAVCPQEVHSNVWAASRVVPINLWDDLKAEGLLETTVPTPTIRM